MSSRIGPRKREAVRDAVFDPEQQFILRLPLVSAKQLHEDLQSGTVPIMDKLSIELQADLRRGLVRYGSDIYSSKLMDMPCIIESHKTLDEKTFYKTADISQMLVCSVDEDLSQEETESPSKKKDKDNKKYMWTHGITAPLKNVRKRRFRKTLEKKYMEQPDIEKEVKQLFRMDAEAKTFKWEVISEDPKSDGTVVSVAGVGGAEAGVSGIDESQSLMSLSRIETSTSLDIAEHDIFGDLSSSDEDEDEAEVNIVDSEEEEGGGAESQAPATPHTTFTLDGDTVDSQDAMDASLTTDLETLPARLDDLRTQLDAIQEQRMAHEAQIESIDNPALKQRFEEMLTELDLEEAEKEAEYKMLLSVLEAS